MMALRNKSTPTLERGMVVSVKPDPRDVKRARGVLAIVCDVSGSGAGGNKVATGYGPITQGNNQETFYVPADRYTIPKIQDLALDAELEKVRRQVMEGTFEEGSCKGLTVQAAHKLGFGDSPRRPKGCRCKMGKCTNFCGCVKAGRKCNSRCSCNGNCKRNKKGTLRPPKVKPIRRIAPGFDKAKGKQA
ncbi:hypothetical protein IV203_032946 [Nitzschia inconspicua]|uniref:Uncharacterized protein n=1 Tax=Nitzschia inconspicua TaxID=303405 RepID=A0A9K3PFK1_9STRA|nr:hypothetical protein IV203_032946 [Nitzschia inconspicua]